MDLFGVVLIEFPDFTSCRICIEAVVLNEMHWKIVGSAGNVKRVGYCPFSGLGHDKDFSVAIEISGSMSRQWILCHDRIWSW